MFIFHHPLAFTLSGGAETNSSSSIQFTVLPFYFYSIGKCILIVSIEKPLIWAPNTQQWWEKLHFSKEKPHRAPDLCERLSCRWTWMEDKENGEKTIWWRAKDRNDHRQHAWKKHRQHAWKKHAWKKCISMYMCIYIHHKLVTHNIHFHPQEVGGRREEVYVLSS